MGTVLELREVVKEYPGAPPVRALDSVSMKIDRGEFVAIVGPSGSGKSTLLNLMGALDRPTSGQVLIEDTDLAILSDRRLSALRGARIGFVFQQFHLLDALSALDNVATGLLYQGLGRSARRREAVTVLERVGLGHRITHRPPQLSGGEKQRVAIARALIGDPAIVLADEPTGNLDSTTTDEIIQLMRELNGQGATLIMITHDIALSKQAERAIQVLDGAITDVVAA